jgi:hypothetical protein
MGNPVLAQQEPVPGQRTRRDSVREWFAKEYNRIVVASPAFPYRDVCTNVPADRGIVAQRSSLAPHPPRDDGTLTGAIRLGRPDLFRQRLAADPASAAKPDLDFGVEPIGWAFAVGRMDMIEALIAAGADVEHHPGFYQLYYNALAWGRRDAALWLIDHARSWRALRGGDDTLDITLEALGPELALHILNKFSAVDVGQMGAMVEAGFNSPFRTKHRQFWLSLLTDSRWKAICGQPFKRCDELVAHLVFQGSDEEVTAFFTRGWLPPSSDISDLMGRLVRQLNAPRIALLATFPYDRHNVAWIRLPHPPPTPIFVPVGPELDNPMPMVARPGERPDTPAERAAALREAQERQRKLAATVAILLKIGVPAENLRQ